MQKVHLQYRDDDSTYLLNNLLTGILISGVYRGYNLSKISNRTLTLVGDAYELTDTGTEYEMSILRTPQGCIVKETDPVYITLDANTSSIDRIDLIYCEHKYTAVEGGTEAIYKIRKGTVDDPPVIMDKKTQVPIATVLIPSGWSGGEGITYTRAKTPRFAEDDTLARKDESQKFTEEQTLPSTKKEFAKAKLDFTTLTSDTKGYDLYVYQDQSSGNAIITSIDFGTTNGKIVQILLLRACSFVGTGSIYLPNGQSIFKTNVGDLITLVDVSDQGISFNQVSKKFMLVSAQSIPTDAQGNYIFESGILLNGSLKFTNTSLSDGTLQMRSLRITDTSVSNVDSEGAYHDDVKYLIKDSSGQRNVEIGVAAGTAQAKKHCMVSITDSSMNADNTEYSLIRVTFSNPKPNAITYNQALWTNGVIGASYGLFNGTPSAKMTVPHLDVETYIEIDKYSLFELDTLGDGAKLRLTNKENIVPGKEITIINTGSYDIKIVNAEYNFSEKTGKDMEIPAKSVVKAVYGSVGYFYKTSEKSYT